MIGGWLAPINTIFYLLSHGGQSCFNIIWTTIPGAALPASIVNRCFPLLFWLCCRQKHISYKFQVWNKPLLFL